MPRPPVPPPIDQGEAGGGTQSPAEALRDVGRRGHQRGRRRKPALLRPGGRLHPWHQGQVRPRGGGAGGGDGPQQEGGRPPAPPSALLLEPPEGRHPPVGRRRSGGRVGRRPEDIDTGSSVILK